jgi:hypothetical protein
MSFRSTLSFRSFFVKDSPDPVCGKLAQGTGRLQTVGAFRGPETALFQNGNAARKPVKSP